MTDYFVRTGGSDAATGLSDAAAWGTLAKAFQTTKLPGDAVALKCGSLFPASLTIKGAGNATSPLTITSYGTGPRPIISAADIPVGWVPDTAVAGGDRWKVVPGFAPGYVHREDASGVRNLTKRTTLASCTALHDWFHDGTTLYVVLGAGEAMPTIHATRRNTDGNEAIDGQDYITLQNHHCRFSLDGGFYGCLHVAGNSVQNTDWTLDNVLLEWGGTGIKFGGQGTNSFAQTRKLTLKNVESRYHREHGAQLIFLSADSLLEDCWFHGNGRSGLGLAMRHGIVRRCRFDENANVLGKWTAPSVVQGFDHGLYLVGQVPNFDRAGFNTISGCTAAKNGKAGFATDALSCDNVFIRCAATENTLYGWMLEGGTSNSSARNRLYHCVAWGNQRSGLHVINAHGPFEAINCNFSFNGRVGNNQDVYVEFNVSTWAFLSGAIYTHGHVDWDPVALCQDDRTLLTRVTGVPTAAGQWSWDAASETIAVWRTMGGPPSTCWVEPVFTLDYNTYTPPAQQLSGHALLRLKTATKNVACHTLAEMQALGLELHGKVADPVYVNAPTDLRLALGSPCIDAGLVLPGFNDDFLGSAPDLGVYEAMPPSSTPPTNAGSYTVVATVNDPNYQGQATGTLVVSKSQAQVSLGALAQTYDGQPKPATVTTTPPGLPVVVTYEAA